MVAAVKHNAFVQNLARAVYNLHTDAIKLALGTADPAAVDVYTSLTGELATASGYTVGGQAISAQSATQTAGVLTFTGTIATLTASGAISFRYAFMYDNTAAAKNVILHWDFGSTLTLASGDSVTFTVSGSGILTIT